ncbi:molecular chaperone GrpE [uncultured Clostridium sp.]|uniref:molecular chaperone GrpE n=1 Tax=uncultured Clostridium sp. TaxID=59620 RepID=UPI0027DAF602|nr:molecular chaperone GrpE [uncultured Clostridium sp.]
MNYDKEQAKEIETIKERTITIKLSDADCERISNLVGKHEITVSQLLENFIGDLVSGTYSNGSDERYMAEQWFNRCWFGMFPEETLLRYLLENFIDVEDFLTTYDEFKHYETNPQEFADEVEEAKENGEEMLWFEEEYHDYIDEFIDNNKDIDMEKEIKLCREWLADFQKLKGKDD